MLHKGNEHTIVDAIPYENLWSYDWNIALMDVDKVLLSDSFVQYAKNISQDL